MQRISALMNALLVDLVQRNKQSLFGALSSSLTSEEKNIIWGDIAQQLSEAYGTERTKDDVAKKTNIDSVN